MDSSYLYDPSRELELTISVEGDPNIFVKLTVSTGTRERDGTARPGVPLSGRFLPNSSLVRVTGAAWGNAGQEFRLLISLEQNGHRTEQVTDGKMGRAGRRTLAAIVFTGRSQEGQVFRGHQARGLAGSKEASPEWPSPEAAEQLKYARDVSNREDQGDYIVWFGTNRAVIETDGKPTGFSSERGAKVHLGTCRVAIPRSHMIGSTGSSWWMRLLRLTDDRLKVVSVTTSPEETYWADIRTALSRFWVPDCEAVVFLHGFNVSFEEAAIRAAQLGVDLGIQGVMAFYSWPSGGRPQDYIADATALEASEGFITDYLISFARETQAKRIHIIAHSMGNRALLRSLDRIAGEASEGAGIRFSHVVVAAADVDTDTFVRLSPAFGRVADHTTMYVCSRDFAIEASQWLHGYSRAGFTPPVLVLPGVDTIEASNVDLTLLGHGYVAESRDVLQDIYNVIHNDAPPEKRFGLRRKTAENGPYWAVGL